MTMDNLDLPSPTTAPETGAPEWQEQIEGLRRAVSSALILMLVVTGSFDVYLLRQVRFTRADLAQARLQAPQVAAQYNQISGQAIQEFAKKLVDYGRTHPDFAPIIAKYKLDEVNKPQTTATKK